MRETSRPGKSTPPRYSPRGRDDLEVGRRPEVHDDGGATVALEGSHGIGDAVCPYLLGVVDQHGHAGPDTGLDNYRWHAEAPVRHLSERDLQRRHHARDNGAGYGGKVQAVEGEQLGKLQGKLVRGVHGVGCHPPMMDEFARSHTRIVSEEAHDDLRVAHIDSHQHPLRPPLHRLHRPPRCR